MHDAVNPVNTIAWPAATNFNQESHRQIMIWPNHASSIDHEVDTSMEWQCNKYSLLHCYIARMAE